MLSDMDTTLLLLLFFFSWSPDTVSLLEKLFGVIDKLEYFLRLYLRWTKELNLVIFLLISSSIENFLKGKL